MRAVFDYILSRRTILAVCVYALLVRLLVEVDAPVATLVALFLALTGQLGHRALDYYGSVKDAVNGVVGAHADRLGEADRKLEDHAKRLATAEQNVARVAQTVERRGAF
jgi:hypothetical protein